MKNMKMKTKIIICFVIPVLFLAVTVFMAISSMSRIHNSVDSMMDRQTTVLEEKLDEIGADEQKAEIIVQTLKESREAEMESIESTVSLSQTINLVFVVVAVIVVIFMSLKLIKAISKSVNQLSRAAKDISLGEIS